MAIQRRPQICRDIPRALLLLLILRTNITESSFQNWSQFIQEGCQLERATTGNKAVINVADSEDFFQLFVSRFGIIQPSITLRTLNNKTHTLLEGENSIFEQPTSVRFFMSNEPKVQFGMNAGKNRTLFFESMGAVRASAILMENVRTTRNCLQGLPYSLLNGSYPQYNPVLRDGESRFVIITKKQKKITLALQQQENSSEFCICWNKTDNSVYLSNTSCFSCPLLPTCVPYFLSLVYENDQISKTLQINGTDIAIKNASRHLTFKTEKVEGDVYVVHDLREFDETSGRQPWPKGDYDFEGPSSGDNEVVPLSVSIAAIVSLSIILIICFKRRPCRNEAPSHGSKQVDICELGRSRSSSDVRRNEQCDDGDYEIYYEEIRTSYVPESQGLSGRPIGLQEDHSCRGISLQEDHDYAEIHTIPYEWEDSHGSNGVVSFETVNDIYEPLETLRRNSTV